MNQLLCALAAAGAVCCSSFLTPASGAVALTSQLGLGSTPAAPVLPWTEIGAKAGADYRGDGLLVTPVGQGARLRCVFQRLEGEATTEGLWLVSTVTNTASDRFRVMAASVGRAAGAGESALSLPRAGTVQVAEQLVRFLRPGLIEEYSVSVDGVRQDFVLMERPAGKGALQVQLAVSGGRVESGSARSSHASAGTTSEEAVVLVLNGSGRRIAYSRLRATDATGRQLPARIETASSSALALRVEDAAAVYPVRIDPTFSDANWISMNPSIPGTDNYVWAEVVDDSCNLYIGGIFRLAGSVTANYIAKWNGSNWSALGSGMNSLVRALAVSGNDLYAGGDFTMAGGISATNIAKWNGSNWSALGTGTGNSSVGSPGVCALATSGSDLYAGGYFTTAGGVSATNVARWNGSNWNALGSGMNGGVNALAVLGSELYAGGGFTMAGGISATNIAKWDGSSWSALGSGMNYGVSALAVLGSDLYVGGWFTTAGGSAANHIAKWDGNSWKALGSGLNDAVTALAVSGGDLYAGGVLATNIDKWDGSSWSVVGSVSGGGVWALAVWDSDLYAGGSFTTAGGSPANYIARCKATNWSTLGSGLNNAVTALAVSGSDLYLGGYFSTVGESTANCIAKWTGTSWGALGSGMDGTPAPGNITTVSGMALSGTDLYAAGWFTAAGGAAATNIAKWNGSNWCALGSGMDSWVGALAVLGSNLYAGGLFTVAGGVPANYIAMWDGNTWSALDTGIGGYYPSVRALAVSGSNLFAGGSFTMAGRISAANIAKWDGSTWSALGSGMNGGVYALAVLGSDLYVAGGFTTAGGISATNIAKWDGSNWSAVGLGMNGQAVSALAVSGSNLYAGGYFTTAGGTAANNIAKWDGSSWSALGSGVSSSVSALAVSANHLYAAGGFTTAGGKFSAYLARAIVSPPVLRVEPDGGGGYFIDFSGVPGSAYRLQRAPGLNGPWMTTAPETAPSSGYLEFWDFFAPPGNSFYRVIQP